MKGKNDEDKYTKSGDGTMHISQDLSYIKPGNGENIIEEDKRRNRFREAVACGTVHLKLSTLEKIEEDAVIKGNVIEYSRVAGIMAAKNCVNMIPSAMEVNLVGCNITFNMDNRNCKINIIATTKTLCDSDAEIAALTAVSTAALTVYDMCMEFDRSITISDIRLLKKITGNPGEFLRP